MNIMRIVMHLVPEQYWKESSATVLKAFVEDAIAIENRLPKEVNLKNELMRYQLCCMRIQEAVCRMKLDEEKEFLGPDYMEWLRALEQKNPDAFTRSRLAACFFPPDSLAIDIERMETMLSQPEKNSGNNEVHKRLDFLRKALEKGAGVVETFDFLYAPGNKSSCSHPSPGLHKTGRSHVTFSSSDNTTLSQLETGSPLENLKIQIRHALKTGEPVNFSNQPHPVITETLNHFSYKANEKDAPAILRVIYMDGSEAEPFPVRCLERQERELQGIIPLKIALVSMRHLEMDDVVDFAWFRNRKVSTNAPFAETDTYCASTTMELLHRVTDGKPLKLHLYQTGLEPAVIGFYRGLVQHMYERQEKNKLPAIEVVPFYFNSRTGGYDAGTAWN